MFKILTACAMHAVLFVGLLWTTGGPWWGALIVSGAIVWWAALVVGMGDEFR